MAFELHTPPLPQPQSSVDPQPSGKPVARACRRRMLGGIEISRRQNPLCACDVFDSAFGRGRVLARSSHRSSATPACWVRPRTLNTRLLSRACPHLNSRPVVAGERSQHPSVTHVKLCAVCNAGKAGRFQIIVARVPETLARFLGKGHRCEYSQAAGLRNRRETLGAPMCEGFEICRFGPRSIPQHGPPSIEHEPLHPHPA